MPPAIRRLAGIVAASRHFQLFMVGLFRSPQKRKSLTDIGNQYKHQTCFPEQCFTPELSK